MKTRRLEYINFLKFIGLSGIIVAHVGPPEYIIFLRSFDVPLMVILSAFLGARSFPKYDNGKWFAGKYWLERTKRLVIPTWIFLCIYFVMMYFIDGFYDVRYYIDSFLLTQYGAGYVWIILIYLYSALLIPFFERLKKFKIFWVVILGIYVVYECFYAFGIATNIKFIETTFYYIVPYGVLAFLGFHYANLSKKVKISIFIISSVIFLTFLGYYKYATGVFQGVQIAKYPPRLYYLSFGIAVTFLLLYLCKKRSWKFYDNKLIRFISEHSMWIYLYHVIFLTLYEYFKLSGRWYVKFVVVYVLSVVWVYVMNKLLDLVERKRSYKFTRYLRG